MQQPITRRDVYEPTLTATSAGREVELASASLKRMLPDPVVGGSLTAASGELVTVEGPDVVETVATPWDPSSQWPPVPETSASVSMDTGAGPVSLLTNGRVISAEGGTSGREVSVEVADQYQSLDKTISWDGFAAATPSEDEGGISRFVGLLSVSVTDKILRHCGWYATPPRVGFAAVSVPAVGTMWPELGHCETSTRLSVSPVGGYPGWVATPWGVGVTDALASYRFAGAQYTIRDRGRLEMVAVPHEGSGRIEVQTNAGAGQVRLRWNQNFVFVDVRQGGAFQQAASMARSSGVVTGTVEYVSGTSVRAIVRSGTGSSTATVSCDAVVTGTAPRRAIVRVEGVASGFQVGFPSTAGALMSWEPNAVLRPRGAGRNSLTVLWPEESESCVDLLAQQCEAEGGTYWIDETGVLQWWDLSRLEARSNVATLNSDDDIDEAGFTWSHSLSAVKSRVTVKWREPLRTWSWRTTVDLWQGSGQTLQSGDVQEDWITVPDDEIWLMTDTNLRRAGTHSMNDLNYGVGSWYGGVRAGSGDEADEWAYGESANGSLLMTMERVTDRAFKTWVQWTGPGPVVQKTPSERSQSALWLARRNLDLPVIRGKAKFVLMDQVTHSAQSGPQAAPEHVIEAGRWIQSEAQAQRTADYYGARMTVPQPALSSIALIPVPGLQLGDMVTVIDEHVSRLTIRGLVIEDSRSINADMDMAHSVAIRPTSVSRNGVTWEEWGAVMAGRTWETWGAQQQPKTWEQWGNDPLDGEVA